MVPYGTVLYLTQPIVVALMVNNISAMESIENTYDLLMCSDLDDVETKHCLSLLLMPIVAQLCMLSSNFQVECGGKDGGIFQTQCSLSFLTQS